MGTQNDIPDFNDEINDILSSAAANSEHLVGKINFAALESDLEVMLQKCAKSARDRATKLTYLAAPYSHKDPEVQEERFHKINKAAAILMARGEHIFSPISHTHPIAVDGNLPRTDWQYWESYDRIYLNISKKIIVLTLPGWLESAGVQKEIVIAEELGIPVEYIAFETLVK